MKKILALLLLSAFVACQPKVVYVNKPALNDSTILKAEMKLSEWKQVLGAIQANAIDVYNGKEDSVKRKNLDTLFYAVQYLDKNLSDSNLNPIFKK